ncbi:MAG: hypothetical protein ACFCU3_00115 [Verrucomicrobiales bacterium]
MHFAVAGDDEGEKYFVVSKKRLVLPLAIVECETAEIEKLMVCLKYEFETLGLYADFEAEEVDESYLFVANDSPLRLLLKPPVGKKTKKKTDKCCDEGCGGCMIPIKSPPATGHFVDLRLRKALKKEKIQRRFHGAEWARVLAKISIEADLRKKSAIDF